MTLQDNFYFFTEDHAFYLENREVYVCWLTGICHHHQKAVEVINYIFCSDAYLHQINIDYLHHDTFTDIITFPLHRPEEPIISDIFISIDRVAENAQNYNVKFAVELRRVMAHGLLHLFGYEDKTAADKRKMRAAEDLAMEMFG